MPEVRVMVDMIQYEEPREGKDPIHRRAPYGTVVDLPDAEVERLSALDPPAVLPVEAVPEEAVGLLPAGPTPATDEAIQAMPPEVLTAYLTQHPEEARRVFDLERASRRDQQVLAATGIQFTDEAPPQTDDQEPVRYDLASDQQGEGGISPVASRRAQTPRRRPQPPEGQGLSEGSGKRTGDGQPGDGEG